MRVLYVCQDAGIPVFGRKGASTHIREVIQALRGRGHEVHLVCADLGPDIDPSFDLPHTQVEPIRSKMLGADLRRALSNLRFGRVLRRIASHFEPDLIYERHSLYTGAATRLAERLGIPHVLEANALLSEELGERLHHPGWAKRIERRQFLTTDRLITVSPGLAATCEGLGVDGAKILTLPMAVDPEHFAPRPRDPARRAEWGWAPDDLVLGYLGAMTGWHRPDLPLLAAAQLARDFPALRLLYIGGAPQHVDRYRRMAEELGLADRVVFLGAVPHREVPDLVAEFDIGSVPGAHQWSTPTKLFEYCSMGIACVAPDNPNIREVLTDGQTAFLFTPESDEALAQTLRRVLEDPERRARVAAEGREHVLAHHTWSKHTERLEAVCKDLLARRQ